MGDPGGKVGGDHPVFPQRGGGAVPGIAVHEGGEARGVAVGLGIPEADVSSPTFTLVQEYRGGRLPLFHADLYRLEAEVDIGALGIEDMLQAGGVVLVEWGERLPGHLKRGATTVRFEDLGEDARRIHVESGPGSDWLEDA